VATSAAHRDTEEVGPVESGQQATISTEMSSIITTSVAADDGVYGQCDRPNGVVSVAVKFTLRPVGRP